MYALSKEKIFFGSDPCDLHWWLTCACPLVQQQPEHHTGYQTLMTAFTSCSTRCKQYLELLLGLEPIARQFISPMSKPIAILLNVHSNKPTNDYCITHRHMYLSVLITETSICSRQWLTQRHTTGQGIENKRLQNAQPYMVLILYSILPSHRDHYGNVGGLL